MVPSSERCVRRTYYKYESDRCSLSNPLSTMTADQLRKSILQQAIQGKLVPQDPKDEPASVLLEHIREEKARLVKEKKAKREKNPSMIFRGEDNSYYEEFTATGEVKCIDDEIPLELPDSWCWVRLRDVSIFLSRGKSPKYSDIRRYPVFAQKCNLKSGGISLAEAKFLDASTLPKWGDEYKLKEQDVLVNSTGTGTVGRVGIFSESILGDYPFAVPDSHVSVVRLASGCSPLYVYQVLSSCLVQRYFEDNLAGSTNQKELYIGVLGTTLVPLPPLAEQERIVAKIEELMPWVEQYGKAQSELDQLNDSIQGRLRKSVLQYAIEGKLVPQQAEDGSAEELLAEIQAEKQRLYAAGKLKKKDLAHSTIFRAEDGMYYEQVGKTITCIDEEIPFDLPESWRWVRFGEITRFSIGKTPERGNQAYWFNGQYPWVAISDMPATGVITRTKEWISQDAVSKCFREIVPKGSLLMSFKLTIGRTSILHMDAYHNEAIISIPLFVDFNDAFRNYLLHVLPIIANMGASKDAIKGKTLNSQSIHNLLLPLPPLAEQQRIVSKLEEVISVLNRLGQ